MKELTKVLGDAIIGVSSGFDRLVFQGMIRPLMYADGAMRFFQRRRILFKDAKRWVVDQTECLVNAVEEWSAHSAEGGQCRSEATGVVSC